MPTHRGRDSKGKYYQWGNHGKKYYYKTESERKKAEHRAIIQGYAIRLSEARSGKTTAQARLRGTSKSKTSRRKAIKTKKAVGSKRSTRRTTNSSRRKHIQRSKQNLRKKVQTIRKRRSVSGSKRRSVSGSKRQSNRIR